MKAIDARWCSHPRECTAQFLCKDPAFAQKQKLQPVTVKFKGEDYLGPGPTSRRIAVVDYNQQLDEVFEPARVKADGSGFIVGPKLDFITNHKLRQVAVWAMINRTLDLVEAPRMFGRPIRWAAGQGRLLVLPHAAPGENAFYDRGTGAIHFLYFEGRNGEQVYTCNSHDIVTHELGHAVLDGLKPGYNEVTSAQTAAFHEYFGDALALTASLSLRDVLSSVVGRPKATKVDKILARIGEEFGSAQGPSPALRFVGKAVSVKSVKDPNEEHDLSEVLTTTFFEHLERRFPEKLSRARKLRKGALDGGHSVNALINGAAETSQLFFRALDYCSPVDVTFAEYALAVWKADRVANPTQSASRDLAMKIFKARGILPAKDRPLRNKDLKRGYEIDRLSATRADALQFLDGYRTELDIPLRANLHVESVYRTKKETLAGYFLPEEVILEFVWTEEIAVSGKRFGDLSGTRAPLYCGGTLVFDRQGNVLHYVLTEDTPERRSNLLSYIEYLVKDGRLGLQEKGFGAHAMKRHSVHARIDGERLTLTRNAALRHQGRSL